MLDDKDTTRIVANAFLRVDNVLEKRLLDLSVARNCAEHDGDKENVADLSARLEELCETRKAIMAELGATYNIKFPPRLEASNPVTAELPGKPELLALFHVNDTALLNYAGLQLGRSKIEMATLIPKSIDGKIRYAILQQALELNHVSFTSLRDNTYYEIQRDLFGYRSLNMLVRCIADVIYRYRRHIVLKQESK